VSTECLQNSFVICRLCEWTAGSDGCIYPVETLKEKHLGQFSVHA